MPRSTSRGLRVNRHRHLRAEVKAVCKDCGRPYGWISAESGVPSYTYSGGRWDQQIRWISNESGVSYTYSGGRWDQQIRGRWDQVREEEGEYHFRHRLRCPCGATQVYTDATLEAKIKAANAAGLPTVAL